MSERMPDKILIDREDLEDLIHDASDGEWSLVVLGSEDAPLVSLVERAKKDQT